MTTFMIDPEQGPGEYDFDKPEDIRRFYANNAVFAVGKFNARNLVNFEEHFGRSLDKAIGIWWAANVYDLWSSAPDIWGEEAKEAIDGVSYDEETNTYITPLGKLNMDSKNFAVQILAFIFSQYGRVIDIDDKGNYQLDPWTYDELLEILDPDVAFAQVEDGQLNLFQKVTQLIRGFSMDDLEVEEPTPVVEEGGPKPKNSRRSTKSEKSTKDR